MAEPANKTRLPLWMTILVAVLFAAGLVHLIYMFTGAYAPYGNFYPAAVALLTVMSFAGLSGVMSAEKWGVWVFGVAVAGLLTASWFFGAFQWAHLLLVLPALLFFSRIGSMK